MSSIDFAAIGAVLVHPVLRTAKADNAHKYSLFSAKAVVATLASNAASGQMGSGPWLGVCGMCVGHVREGVV